MGIVGTMGEKMVRPRNSIMPYICTITDLNISNTNILCLSDSLSTGTKSFTVSFTVWLQSNVLQFHGVGMNHPRCLRIYTQAVTQIGVQDRQPQAVVVCTHPMGHWHAHLQCITDMPCMTLGESLKGVGLCTTSIATAAVLGSLYEAYRGFVS